MKNFQFACFIFAILSFSAILSFNKVTICALAACNFSLTSWTDWVLVCLFCCSYCLDLFFNCTISIVNSLINKKDYFSIVILINQSTFVIFDSIIFLRVIHFKVTSFDPMMIMNFLSHWFIFSIFVFIDLLFIVQTCCFILIVNIFFSAIISFYEWSIAKKLLLYFLYLPLIA